MDAGCGGCSNGTFTTSTLAAPQHPRREAENSEPTARGLSPESRVRAISQQQLATETRANALKARNKAAETPAKALKARNKDRKALEAHKSWEGKANLCLPRACLYCIFQPPHASSCVALTDLAEVRGDRFVTGPAQVITSGTAQARPIAYHNNTSTAMAIPDWQQFIIDEHMINHTVPLVYGDYDGAVLRAYSGQELYRGMNMALCRDDDEELKQYGGYVFVLRNAIVNKYLKQGALSGTVYRYQNLTDEQRSQYVPGFTFLLPNAVSTSKKELSNFGGTKFIINLDAALGTTFAADISSYSLYPAEEEVLFHPYSGFEVTSVEIDATGHYEIKLRPVDTKIVEPLFET